MERLETECDSRVRYPRARRKIGTEQRLSRIPTPEYLVKTVLLPPQPTINLLYSFLVSPLLE